MSLMSGDTTLVQILICARVDIGNEIFSGLPIASIYELLHVINSAIVPIGGSHVWPHSLKYAAWLHTQQSIWFNILSLSPSYLRDLCISVPVVRPPGRDTVRSAARLPNVHRMHWPTAIIQKL